MMSRRLMTFGLLLVAAIAVRAADDISIQADPHTDFSRFGSFAIRRTTIDSPRPELDNPLFVKKLNTTIRGALGTRGLKETKDGPDLVVDITLSGEDVSTTQRGAIRGAGPSPLMYTEGTLTIELSRPGDTSPVWRGIYRDDEKTGSKLMAKLPDDARKLIDRYPKR